MPPNTQYDRHVERMACKGVNVFLPPDVLPPGKFSRLLNVRATADRISSLTARPGYNDLLTGMTGDVHSIRRLNDNIGSDSTFVGDFTYVVGAGTSVYRNPTGAMTLVSSGWSGRPLSLVHWRPDASPRAFMYVFDADQQQKVGRTSNTAIASNVAYPIGITAPVTAPVVANIGGLGPTGDYRWRYRYRSTQTGEKSNPSPIPVSVFTATGGVSVTVIASTDPHVDTIDIFRQGEDLLDYVKAGEISNTGTLVFNDHLDDIDLQTAEILEVDNDQPFTTVGLPMIGTVTVATDVPEVGLFTITRVTGKLFITDNKNLKMAPGTIISVDNIDYVLYSPPSDDSTVIVRGNYIGGAGTVPYQIQEPTLLHKSLPFVWGPFENCLLACGDIYRPGNLYWTNPNNPDGASSANNQEVTSPSEPLMNGFILGERAFVFSSERLYSVHTAFDDKSQWTILGTPCQKGLYTNWAFCCEGTKQGARCWFLAKDGIYETQGGEAKCITDVDLFPLFPNEGNEGVAANGYLPPDMSQRTYLRLSYDKGKVYFNYKDTSGTPKCLVYDPLVEGWFPDDYQTDSQVFLHYSDEAREGLRLLGCGSGKVMLSFGHGDNGQPIGCQIRTRTLDLGDPGTRKLWGDATYDLDTGDATVTIQSLFSNETSNGPSETRTASGGRRQFILDLLGSESRNMGIDFQWTTQFTPPIVYLWIPSASPKPEDSQRRVVDWHEILGDDAYVIGIRLWVDTRDDNQIAQTKTVQVWADQAFTGNTLTILSNGEQKLEFSWPQFKGKLGRLVPTDSARWRVTKWEWIAEPEPFDVSKWDTNWKDAVSGAKVGYVTGVVVEADTHNVLKNVILESELEGVVSIHAAVGGNTLTHNGRLTKTFSFSIPFRARQLRLSSTDAVIGRLYDVSWIAQPTEPNKLTNFDANFEDSGYLGAKFMQGCVIDADTEGQTKILDIEFEDGTVETFSINHAKRMGRAYSFRFPVPATKFRALPRDANPGWLYGVRWVWEPHPESASNWETQFTTLGLKGYGHVRDAYIALEGSVTEVFVVVTTDADKYAIAIPPVGAQYRKVYVVFKAIKSKRWKWQVTSLLPADAPVLYTTTL